MWNVSESKLSICYTFLVLVTSERGVFPILIGIPVSSILSNSFLSVLKYAEVTPVYKKDDLFNKINNRPLVLHSM